VLLKPLPILFPRIQSEKLESLKNESEKTTISNEDKMQETITIEDFSKVKLTTAKVLTAESVPGTSKLLKLQINLGTEQRQIVAGIAEYYTPDQIVGKTIIVIKNLQPATIRGVQSNGMLLAAIKDQKLTLLTVMDEFEPGADIS